ncbi:MAG: GIY-YIG nuclease family protein [Armatimonadetes bacterium]|nr:MAG: GIY-YIG nuclease family protein [Armatimonadota bacterium]
MSETSDVSDSKFYVYILQSLRDKGLYIGYTTDLKKRLVQHANGRVVSTKLRLPFKLIHYEYFVNSKDAKAREEYLKSGYGRKQLKEFLKNTLSFSQSLP